MVKNSPANAGDARFNPWVKRIPWRRKWQPTPVLLPGEAHGQRSQVGFSPQSRKESDMTEHTHEPAVLCTAGLGVGMGRTQPQAHPLRPG